MIFRMVDLLAHRRWSPRVLRKLQRHHSWAICLCARYDDNLHGLQSDCENMSDGTDEDFGNDDHGHHGENESCRVDSVGIRQLLERNVSKSELIKHNFAQEKKG